MDDDVLAAMAARIITDAEEAAEAYFTAGVGRPGYPAAYRAWDAAVPFLPGSVAQDARAVFGQRFAALAALN